jgi:1,2-diacylglycerol 3-beta-galactosyltransferase
MFIEGFTREVPFYMELADFFIGKPGPGSISEALAKRLPVIVQRNAWTLAHERYNADWVEEQGTGLVVKDFAAGIGAAVETLLQPENYVRFRERVAGGRNTAVFEIPDILDRIMRPVRPEIYPAERKEVAA